MILKVVASIIGIILFFTGCTKIPTTQERMDTAFSLFNDKDIVQKNIQTSSFKLFTLQKITSICKNRDMKVYIEGDGLAWITSHRISDDPTPLHPLALSLMSVDESSCKVYIARPCQYNITKECDNRYWTSHRFSHKIIKNFNEALTTLKQNAHNSSFTLIGYSGGGAVATLLSASRDDISKLITVAGNVDTGKWVKLHNISPLNGSLNPADYTKKLESIPQYHLIGADDKNMPKEVFLSYLNRFNNKKKIKYHTYNATHNCCWIKAYKKFLKGLKKDEPNTNR